MSVVPRPRPPASAPRALLAALATLMLAPWVRGQDGAEAPPPAAVDVLRTAPFDRITLTDGKSYNVEPILPRPLPPYDPSKDPQAKENSEAPKAARPPREGNVFLPGQKRPKAPEGPPQLNELTVHLTEGEVRDFQIRRAHIKSVEYFEDMLLAQADRYRLANEFARAFECCLRVRSRDPAWPGLDDAVNRVLMSEGSAALLAKDTDRGLRLLRELHERQPRYPGLADKLAETFGARIERAFELGRFAAGRRLLHELAELAPDHPRTTSARERFVSRARKLAEEAEHRHGDARVEALAEALRVWPTLEGAEAKFSEAFRASPLLEVGVLDLPRSMGPWGRSPADARVQRLLYRPLLARDDEEAMKGQPPSQLAESVEISDLGRRISIRLRSGAYWSDGSRPVSATDVARALTDRVEPACLGYQARWADVLDRVDTPEEFRVDLRLSRPILRPGSWLLGPIGPAHASPDGRVATLKDGLVQVGDGPFRWLAAAGDRARLQANPSAAPPLRAKLARLDERRFAEPGAALGALMRGEVSLVEHVPPRSVGSLSAQPEIKVGRYADLSLHRIALDGRTPALRNRTLRRALSYAIDRRTLLAESVLGRPPDDANRPSDALFARGSYAHAPDVRPLGYDPLLAKMLVAAARKELGNRPIKLAFEYPARAEAQAAAPRIAEALRLVGVEVVLQERGEAELESELRSGRRFDIAYRASACDEPVVDAGGLICPGYDASPSADALGAVASPRILQLLLQLERAPEWASAKGTVVEIDRECRDELPLLPLWQLEDHYAWRTRLKGPAEVAASLYEGVESWEIEPWYAKDPF